jgi:hypothetical protein
MIQITVGRVDMNGSGGMNYIDPVSIVCTIADSISDGETISKEDCSYLHGICAHYEAAIRDIADIENTIRSIHTRVRGIGTGYYHYCSTCDDGDGGTVEYPCPTVKAFM